MIHAGTNVDLQLHCEITIVLWQTLVRNCQQLPTSNLNKVTMLTILTVNLASSQ